MRIDFDKIIPREGTSCKRWDMIKKQYNIPNLIPMGIADMDLPAPPEIIYAIQERLQHLCFGYTYPLDNLLDAIQKTIKTQFNWDIQKEWILLYPDATFSLNHILQKIPFSSNNIILQPPVFGPFFTQLEEANYNIVINPLVFKNNNYYFDFDHFKDLLKNNNIGALLLCNPHNPIGRVWTEEELQELGDLCIKNNILIISDELHSSLIYPNYSHTSIASLNHNFANQSITIMSSGKTFNIPGLKVSFLIIPNNQLKERLQNTISDPNILGMIAYEAAIKAGDEYYIEELMLYISNNFTYMKEFINNKIPQLSIIDAQATFLTWVDMRNLKLSSEQLEDFMINKANIFATNGASFGKGGDGFMRLNIAMPFSKLKQALDQLEIAVNQYSE